MKKCIYCGKEIHDVSVIDFCHVCGVGVFGEKMFKTIVKNMEDARENGDLMNVSEMEIKNSPSDEFEKRFQ